MKQNFETITNRKLNLMLLLSTIALILAASFAYLWLKERNKIFLFSKNITAFRSTEQVDRQHAQSWGSKYDSELSNGNTVAISFDYDAFVRIVSNWYGLRDRQGNKADQVLVKLVRYDATITRPEYGSDPRKQPDRVSVCFYPYNKARNLVIDNGADISKPLNLGDLHP